MPNDEKINQTKKQHSSVHFNFFFHAAPYYFTKTLYSRQIVKVYNCAQKVNKLKKLRGRGKFFKWLY